jgi:hypothetical protein
MAEYLITSPCYVYGGLMNEFELGYLAASIDAEGSIMIKLQGSKRRTFRPTLSITNTSKKYLEYLVSFAGGKIYTHSAYYNKEKQKPAWILMWQNYSLAKQMCELLKDRLVIKKDHARILLEFMEVHLSYKGWRDVWHMPQEVMQREKKLYDELKQLNKRGR